MLKISIYKHKDVQTEWINPYLKEAALQKNI